MSKMNQQQFEQFIDTIKNSSESFSMEGNWVFTQFPTPNARIIYGDITDPWKEYGVYSPKQLIILAIVTNDGSVYYNDEELIVSYATGRRLPDFKVQETEQFQSFSTVSANLETQARKYVKDVILDTIPRISLSEDQKAKCTRNARYYLFCNYESVPTISRISHYLLHSPCRDIFPILCKEQTIENLFKTRHEKYITPSLDEFSIQITEEEFTQPVLKNPELCCKDWELGLVEKIKEVEQLGAKTVSVTFVTDFDTGKVITRKYELERFLNRLAQGRFDIKLTNENIESVTYRGKELLGYAPSLQREEEELIIPPLMTM